jgi:hypothetical protein
MQAALKNTHSNTHQDLNAYLISYGSKFAQHKIEIFYSIECGLSREFIQNDLLNVFEQFDSNFAAQIILYPVGLDKMTLCFAEKIRNMNNLQKLESLIAQCQVTRNLNNFDKMNASLLEEIFFDIAKILEDHPEITETLMVKINGEILTNVPSIHAIQERLCAFK